MTPRRLPVPAIRGGRFMPVLPQFSEDLMNHIHLENNVLFPQFEA